MSIFVDRNKLFIVQIVGRYIHDNNGNNIGFKIQKDGDVVVEASASGRDFETMSKIIEDAKKAFDAWANTPPLQRARVMFKFKELIEKNSDELTKIIVAEHGKVYEDAKGSLTRGLEVVEFACGIPNLLKGEFSENVGTNVDSGF